MLEVVMTQLSLFFIFQMLEANMDLQLTHCVEPFVTLIAWKVLAILAVHVGVVRLQILDHLATLPARVFYSQVHPGQMNSHVGNGLKPVATFWTLVLLLLQVNKPHMCFDAGYLYTA
jgi:hypothetical protein